MGTEHMELYLERPNAAHEAAFTDFTNEWNDAGEAIIPFSARLRDMDYQGWLAWTYRMESEETCDNEFVPAHTYFLMQNGRILGAINIRHRLNDFLLNYGGHIGYGVRPSERRKGYAATMLEMGLGAARKLGLSRVLVCCDKVNTASAKTIMACSGILENEIMDDGELLQRYWIAL